MKLCGWKTRSMFDRYNIILGVANRHLLQDDEADLARAVGKRFANGIATAYPEAPTAPPTDVTSSAV
jgi:hypothetical protein